MADIRRCSELLSYLKDEVNTLSGEAFIDGLLALEALYRLLLEEHLLTVIRDPASRQAEVVAAYRAALERSDQPALNWARVNRAIPERWSRAGLSRIKQMARGGHAHGKREVGT